MKIEDITETIEKALGDIVSIPPNTRMLFHASANGNRENTNYIFILEMFDENEYTKIKEEHLRLDDPDHIASEMFYNKKKIKSGDYAVILDSLYHGNHDIEFTKAVKLLFNMSHWLNRNYIVTENFKYNISPKTNGTVFYSFKTGKRQEFQLVFFLDRLADGGLVMDMADHDFVAPIKNQTSNEQEEEPPYVISS
ncbi:MAG: hypothetical protein EU530_01480 [Promethearchaeota archaeon]|nr:MAG: hypothetical protein EU530_01480 [Candidatus Lokiarchaeota archaeon]